MPRIRAHTLDTAPDASRDTLSALGQRMGKILNIHAGMANSPLVIEMYAAMSSAIREHGTIDARTRETIALAVGSVNGCDYCQSAHTLSAKAAGLSEAQTIAIRADHITFDDKLATVATIARQISADTGTVTDAAWQDALAAGWSAVELTETFAHVAVNLYTNYFNHYAGTELDLPAAPALSA